jgi:hypothetical protein
MAVVEGCLRILISEKSENPEDYICAMILQYFERPDSEKNA